MSTLLSRFTSFLTTSRKKITRQFMVGFVVVALVLVGYRVYVFAATGDVTGYACTPNIGCISLNPQTSAGMSDFGGQPGGFGVTYNTVTKTFSGSGWNPRVGMVSFGTSCSSRIQSLEGTSASGNVCARVDIAQGASDIQTGGWDGFIFLGNVTLSPDNIHFTGKGWEGINTDNTSINPSTTGIGWLDFTYARFNGQVANITLTTVTPTVVKGDTGVLQWTVTGDVASCVATAALGSSMSGTSVQNEWTQLSSSQLVAMYNNGTISLTNMQQQTTFQLVCVDTQGNTLPAVTATIDVLDPSACLLPNPPAWCDQCKGNNPPAWCKADKLKPIYKEN
jgi:hypothetical protein